MKDFVNVFLGHNTSLYFFLCIRGDVTKIKQGAINLI